MVVFALEVEKHPKVKPFVDKLNKKLQTVDLVKNPFKGKLVLGKDKVLDKLIILVSIFPLYPNYTPLIWVTTGMLLVVFGFFWLTYICLALCLLSYFWSTHFYTVITKSSLKRHGYEGKIKVLNSKEILEKVIFKEVQNGTTRSL